MNEQSDKRVYVRAGNAALTRTIRRLATQAGSDVVDDIQYRSGRYPRRLGIYADAHIVAEARAHLAATADRRDKEKKKRADRAAAEMRGTIMSLYPAMSREEADDIARHATLIGSRRVGRSTSIDPEDAAHLAVRAYARHTYTDYEELLESGVDRDSARAETAADIREVVQGYRTGEAAL